MAKTGDKSSNKPAAPQEVKFGPQPEFTLSPDFGRPSANIPEFVVIMLEAIQYFGINPTAGVYPKKEELVAYFTSRRLSNGSLISPHHAEALATFCRPVSAMKGGLKG
jgi:hypothetical protein